MSGPNLVNVETEIVTIGDMETWLVPASEMDIVRDVLNERGKLAEVGLPRVAAPESA